MSDVEARGSVPEGALVGGRFRVERLIGRGGMGEVYAARHVTTGKEVALKLIHAVSGSGGDEVRRFMREARAATAIEHPNVIEVFDVFEDTDGTPVMVMELLKGEPFSACLERAGALKLYEVAAIFLPAIHALKAAHEKGIVHRDLKPDNVFLATSAAGRTTKLLDFGIAKVLDPMKLGSDTRGQETSTGSILGTPHYMSYEQAMSDKHIDQRADIWALGVILFEALTGRRPVMFDSLGQMYASFLQGTVPSIREFLPDLPDDVAKVLDHCLVKTQEHRLDELGPLIEILEKYADASVHGAHVGGRVVSSPTKSASAEATTGSPLSSSVQGFATRRRTRLALAATAALVIAGGAGAFAAWRQPASVTDDHPVDPPPPPPLATATSVPQVTATTAEPALPAAPAVAHSSPLPVKTAAPMRSDAAPGSPSSSRAAGPPSTSPSASSAPANPKKGISDKLPY